MPQPPELPRPPQTWSGVDLHLQGRLLGAQVWRRAASGLEGGRVVTYDEEGMLVARFSKATGKVEMTTFRIFYTDTVDEATVPGTTGQAHRLARDICMALGSKKVMWDDWDRRMLGYAAFMIHPYAA